MIPAVVLSALFLGAALFLRLSARYLSGFSDAFASWANPLMTNVLGRVSDLLPLSLVELLIYGILLAVLSWLILLVKAACTRSGSLAAAFFKGIRRMLLLASLIFLLYEAGEDVYFYCEAFSAKYGFGSGAYSTEDLTVVCEALVKRCNALSSSVERNADGIMQVSESLPERTVRSMQELGRSCPLLGGFYSRPKGILLSELMSRTNMAGIYSAYTCEANYNRSMTPYNLPFTMSHELSHEKGIMQENEANFAAFLACFPAKDSDIAYSGALSGWVYCGNELYKRDYGAWLELHQSLDEDVIKDLDANTAFWEAYRSPVSRKAQSFNDSYLKRHGQKDGTASYDRVVDLIVSWYLSKMLQ